eukprot:TRINITY_DN1821_c0_g1_i2.p2 TRINITY_DN1821_c0_g1~~TRINITY_DN1821_c0_g1_i2.p2  ORF type:complete len:124 (-),score=27.71 TRINITY_DN1821_c0_g1_i2:391-762(-)
MSQKTMKNNVMVQLVGQIRIIERRHIMISSSCLKTKNEVLHHQNKKVDEGEITVEEVEFEPSGLEGGGADDKVDGRPERGCGCASPSDGGGCGCASGCVDTKGGAKGGGTPVKSIGLPSLPGG